MSNDDQRSYKSGPIIAVAVALLLVGYVGAYFGLSEFDNTGLSVRIFNAKGQIEFFKPALLAEGRIRGVELFACVLTENVGYIDIQQIE